MLEGFKADPNKIKRVNVIINPYGNPDASFYELVSLYEQGKIIDENKNSEDVKTIIVASQFMRYKYYGRKFDKDKTSNFSPEIKDIILNLMFEGVVTIGDDMFGLLRPTFANGIRRSDKIIILDSLINAKRIENQEFSDALFNIDLMDDSGIGNKNEFIEWLINLEFPGNGESEQKAETFMASFGQYLLDDIEKLMRKAS